MSHQGNSQDGFTRRPAEQLQVLNDLARRLAIMREPQGVLQEVAVQARRLLAVDVAYIMLRGEGDVLRIEVIDGTMGSALRGIELTRGRGLGGMVLETGEPAWSPSYLEDDRFPHIEGVDAAASSEHLAGILAVPLLVNEEPLGVLLVAERRPRSFSSEEIELLAALAAHAAVAIRNAQLFEDYSQAMELLRHRNVELQQAAQARQQAADLRDQLTRSVIAGAGVREVCEILGRYVRVEVSFVDRFDQVAAGALASEDLRLILDSTSATDFSGAAGHDPVVQIDHTWLVAPILLRTGYAGFLACPAGDGSVETMRDLAIGSLAVALVLVSEQSLLQGELRARGELLSTLLSPGSDITSLRRRARASHLDVDAEVSVVACVVEDEAPEAISRLLTSRIRAGLPTWSAEADGLMVLLVRHLRAEDVVSRLRGTELSGAVGVSYSRGGPEALRAAVISAQQTAWVLQSLGKNDVVALDTQLGPYRALLGQSPGGDLAGFIDSAVGPIAAYDTARGSQLCATALVYLNSGRQHSTTCAALHIHPNTLYQRLSRIDNLLGSDWRGPAAALDIHLALTLRQLAGRLAS